MKKCLFCILILLALSLSAAKKKNNPLPNPGFEEGDKMWAFRDSTSKLAPEAAHEGENGLRVGDEEYNSDPGSVTSAKLSVNPDRKYFVLQGHPAAWGGPRFDEFVKIIDFLTKQKCVFMTPVEYVKSFL